MECKRRRACENSFPEGQEFNNAASPFFHENVINFSTVIYRLFFHRFCCTYPMDSALVWHNKCIILMQQNLYL